MGNSFPWRKVAWADLKPPFPSLPPGVPRRGVGQGQRGRKDRLRLPCRRTGITPENRRRKEEPIPLPILCSSVLRLPIAAQGASQSMREKAAWIGLKGGRAGTGGGWGHLEGCPSPCPCLDS